MLISDLLKQNARLYPDEIALIELHPGKNLRKAVTWREFDEQANRLANALIERGIKKDDKVIHLMMNSIDWLVVYFGIIRTGAWAVPLNFRFTGTEIKYCAGHCGSPDDDSERRVYRESCAFARPVTDYREIYLCRAKSTRRAWSHWKMLYGKRPRSRRK